MKYFAPAILSTLTFVLLMSFSACGGNSNANADAKGKEYTANYVCPMHCEGSGSEKPGKCPVCKMDYVANTPEPPTEVDPHEGHNHDHGDHSGHNH